MRTGGLSTHDDQAHFDKSAEARERSRQLLAGASGAALHRGGAEALRRQASADLDRLGRPDDAIAFGRIDLEDEQTWYIGNHAIWDDASDPLVINWRTEPAAPYYAATAADPAGVRLKRSFECDGNKILSFEDVLFEQLGAEIAQLEGRPLDDALLKDLERHRSGEMADIVKTIQAAQYELLREPLDQLLIIEGGPGTGKTAIGLHRVSWLLYNHRDELSASDVLVVGPNRTFVRYIRQVLPELGDAEVAQVDLTQLGPSVRLGRDEADEVARIKGELRMRGLLERAVANRIRPPDAGVTLSASGASTSISAERISEEIERLRRFPYSEGRSQFRQFIRREVAGRYSRDTRPLEEEITRATDRIWPALTAESLVQDLYGSRARLIGAAGDDFTGRDIELLYRQAAERVSQEHWSWADVAVLDRASHLLDPARTTTYGHIVVDEAQDLSPMQADMIARRSRNRSMTVLGDISQSTGSWARESWADLVETWAGDDTTVSTRTLRYGYRVPTQVYEPAADLLHRFEPDAEVPTAVREGPSDPRVIACEPDGLASNAVQEARNFAGNGLSVGLVCSTEHWNEVTTELAARGVRWTDASTGDLSGSINIVRPEMAKGLEFDAVVVVDPIGISRTADRGHRLLYIAMTRTTTHLAMVNPVSGDPSGAPSGWHDLDIETSRTEYDSGDSDVEKDLIEQREQDFDRNDLPDASPTPSGASPRGVPRVVEAMAEIIASDVGDLPPERQEQVLRRAAEILAIDL